MSDETNEHSRSGINQEKAMKNVEILPSGNISEPNVETKPSTINHESQAPCKHESSWFDRTICMRGDGRERMATICNDCGKDLDCQAPAASNTGKELKPCPFCGQPVSICKSPILIEKVGFVVCHNMACVSFSSPRTEGQAIETWNKAWAHKRIEELEKDFEWSKSVVEKLERRVSKQNYYVNEADKKIASLESQLAQLQERNGELSQQVKDTGAVADGLMKDIEAYKFIIAGLEKRNAELDRDLDETRDQMKTEKCDYCFDNDQKAEIFEKQFLSDCKKIADLEKRNAELVTKCHQLESKLKTAEDKLAAVQESEMQRRQDQYYGNSSSPSAEKGWG